jgi:predicted dehydrogenase
MKSFKRREFIEAGARATAAVSVGVPLVAAASAAAPRSGKRIKVGQIGTGHAHASGKISTLRKLDDDYDIVGVAEPDANLRRQWENHPAYRHLRWMSEEELLGTPGLEAVTVETAVRDLVPTAARCVAAGKHLHLDKPAGPSLAAFKAVLDQADRKGLTVQMGYMFRNNPALLFCFKAVREGWLGEVFELDAVISKAISDARRPPLAEFSGGSMFELGCHLIDAAVAVLGKPDKVTSYLRRTRGGQDDLADNTLAVLEYPQATCTIRSALIEVEGNRRRQFVVCGTRGTIDIRPLEPPKLLLALSGSRNPFKRGYQEVKLPAMPGRYDDQLAELARIIRGEQPNPYPPEHDLAVHETVLRASGIPLD